MSGRLSHHDLREGVEQLCELLEAAATALAAFDADALIAIEPSLAKAVAQLQAASPVHVPAALGPLGLRAKAALRRCEQLGMSFATIAGLPLHGADAYGRDGSYIRPSSRPALQVVT